MFLSPLTSCVDLFHKPVFVPQSGGKMSLFTVNREREKQREGEVSCCQRWDFADSIFTHQTELFPVSTWPNSRSHHLTLSLSVYLCFISLFPPRPPDHLSGRFPLSNRKLPLNVFSLFQSASFILISVLYPVFSPPQAFHLFCFFSFYPAISLSQGRASKRY